MTETTDRALPTPSPGETARIAGFLRQIPLFAALSESQAMGLANASTFLNLPAKTWLIRKGEPGKDLYIILSGALEIVNEDAPGELVIATLLRGDFVGEFALLMNRPRTASVRAKRDSELVRIGESDLSRLLLGDARVCFAMASILADRLHRESATARRERGRSRVIALVTSDRNSALKSIVSGLARELGKFSRVAVIGPDSGTDSSGSGAAERLDSALTTAELVLLMTEDWRMRGSAWTRFCLTHADRVVFFADAEFAPQGPERDALIGCDIVIGGDISSFEHYSRFTAALLPRTHHLVRSGGAQGDDIARMARRLAGRAVGLVLSGGAARAQAHIGALRAIEEAGLIIDRVGGTSMGAVIGSLFASGRSAGEIRSLCEHHFAGLFRDYGIPTTSLLKGTRALEMLSEMFGGLNLEELPIKTFCVSSDLVSAQAIVHREGPIVEAVACSAAIPGVFPPVRFGDRILVDGCILNNLPTDVMAADGEGPIIAIDVTVGADFLMSEHDAPARPAAVASVSGSPLRYDQSNRPGIITTLLRAGLLNSVGEADEKRSLADIVIAPDCRDYGLFDFKKLPELFEAGYRAAATADLPLLSPRF